MFVFNALYNNVMESFDFELIIKLYLNIFSLLISLPIYIYILSISSTIFFEKTSFGFTFLNDQ